MDLACRTAFSELQAHHQRALPRLWRREGSRGRSRRIGSSATYSRRADIPESSGGLAVDPGLGRECIPKGRNIYPRPIEDIAELGADLYAGSFLDPEVARQAHALLRPALLTVVAVVSVRRAKMSQGRIRPCLGIQHKRRVGIEAMTIQIGRVEWFSRYPVHVRALEDEGIEVGGGCRNLEGESAGIPQHGADGPVARCP